MTNKILEFFFSDQQIYAGTRAKIELKRNNSQHGGFVFE